MPEQQISNGNGCNLPANPKITHCLFDMDGLLLDTETYYSIAFEKVCSSFGKEFTWEVKRKIMGRTGPDVSRMIVELMNLPVTPEEFQVLIDKEYTEVFSKPIPIMPGAMKLVKHLHKHGVPIAVATSSKGFTFNLKTSHHPELFSMFHHMLVASEDPEIVRGKPDPQTFLVCASRFDDPPKDMSQCLVFEDSVAGVQAGNAAGAYTVWVPDSRMDRNAAKPFLTLDSLEQFKPEDFGLPPYSD